MNFRLLSTSAVACVFFTSLSTALALPVPDTGTCASGPAACLQINAMSGNAVYGLNNGTGTGVAGFSSSGHGIVGASGSSDGVFGNGTAAARSGVYGLHTNNGDGVTGRTSGAGRSGVYGEHTGNGFGVAGRVTVSSTGSAIFGDTGNSSSAWAGDFNGKVRASSFVTVSDARLKTDVRDLPYGLRELGKLRPVAYTWREQSNSKLQLGLIAQEVRGVFPDVVETDVESEMLSVNYQALIPVIIGAVQEQQKLIEAQKRLIGQQEKRISVLEKTKQPILSSVFGGGGDLTMLSLCIVPASLFVAWRKRRRAEVK